MSPICTDASLCPFVPNSPSLLVYITWTLVCGAADNNYVRFITEVITWLDSVIDTNSPTSITSLMSASESPFEEMDGTPQSPRLWNENNRNNGGIREGRRFRNSETRRRWSGSSRNPQSRREWSKMAMLLLTNNLSFILVLFNRTNRSLFRGDWCNLKIFRCFEKEERCR